MIEYNLNFMHPQYGTTLNVDIDGSFTVEEMINNLLLSGFINENKNGYDFELMGQALERQMTFDEIQELYDGAVIKIIAHKDDAPEIIPAQKEISLRIKHPTEPLILDIQLPKDSPLSSIIQQASEKNFVQGVDGILHLQKGDKLLDLNENALQNGLTEGDFLQLTQVDAKQENPLETAVDTLNQKLEQLETQLQNQLVSIKDALPAANMIPIDPTRAVNPTMEHYESIDTIVNRLREASKEPPLKPIRPISLPILLMEGLLLVIALLVVLLLTGVIRF
ncbi:MULTISPECIES: hypothetical protein [unclassified Aureispira]|uniref:hypothetical protein n=1 Tax=unclassified Aureispira TaxID=2649989 RepID=UPI00069646D0|nr:MULTISPECIES: hypothetical protein [unclassified Aureispira]WMX13073.1 hypothetical protein QP953_19725 [Aureispira sp. CCB-E]